MNTSSDLQRAVPLTLRPRISSALLVQSEGFLPGRLETSKAAKQTDDFQWEPADSKLSDKN